MTKEIKIVIGETGPDWEPIAATKFFAQVEDPNEPNGAGTFDLGSTPAVAVTNLLNKLGLNKPTMEMAK